jgi:hypothetical protein
LGIDVKKAPYDRHIQLSKRGYAKYPFNLVCVLNLKKHAVRSTLKEGNMVNRLSASTVANMVLSHLRSIQPGHWYVVKSSIQDDLTSYNATVRFVSEDCVESKNRITIDVVSDLSGIIVFLDAYKPNNREAFAESGSFDMTNINDVVSAELIASFIS